MAALYVEDIGTEAIKTSGSNPEQGLHTFKVKVDKKEKSKRKRRMVSQS